MFLYISSHIRIIIIIIITVSIIITIITVTVIIVYHYYYYYYSYIVMLLRCKITLYNAGSKALIRLSGRRSSCLVYTRRGMFWLDIVLMEIQSWLSNKFLIRIRLVPWNTVIVTTDLYGKNLYGRGYTQVRKVTIFLPSVKISNYYFL